MLHALASSDWHLGSMKNVLGENALQIQLNEIEKVYKYAVKKGYQHLFVPGDLFDTPIVDISAIIGFIKILHRYSECITTYYIAGNHDYSEKGKTSLDLLKLLIDLHLMNNVHVYIEPTQVVIEDITVNFIPFPSLKSLPNEQDPNNGCLNIAHVDCDGATNDYGVYLSVDSSKKFVQNPKDFVISGHVHKHQVLRSSSLLYVGSLFQKTFGESLPKGVIDLIVDYDESGRIRIKHKFIKVNSSINLEVLAASSDEEASQIHAKIQANPNVKYKIVVSPNVIIPSTLATEFSNVVKITGTKTSSKNKQEYASKIQELITDTEVSISPLYGLDDFLLSKGLGKKEISTAKNMVKEFLDSTSTSSS